MSFKKNEKTKKNKESPRLEMALQIDSITVVRYFSGWTFIRTLMVFFFIAGYARRGIDTIKARGETEHFT